MQDVLAITFHFENGDTVKVREPWDEIVNGDLCTVLWNESGVKKKLCAHLDKVAYKIYEFD